jgi:hypothetical protein
MPNEIQSYVCPAHPTARGGSAKRLLRGCVPVTAYTAGWEDTRYARQYTNPFMPGSAEWREYDTGNQDARCKAVLL